MKQPDCEACEPASFLALLSACVAKVKGHGGGRTGQAPNHRARGFTLIELLVVILIVSVGLIFAVPSFRSITQNNRVSSQVNTFVGDVQYARSEAIRQGAPVSMCPSSNGTACLATNTWHSGWIIFSDPNSSGTVNTGDAILRTQRPWTSTDTLVATPAATAITYTRDGFSSTPSTTFVLHTTPTDNKTTRCVALNTVGRQTLQKAGTGSCT